LSQEEPVDSQLAVYVNRLSDYLYVLACRINHLSGVEENLWKKMM
jgi:cob(I)alamin adenosyltransferase